MKIFPIHLIILIHIIFYSSDYPDWQNFTFFWLLLLSSWHFHLITPVRHDKLIRLFLFSSWHIHPIILLIMTHSSDYSLWHTSRLIYFKFFVKFTFSPQWNACVPLPVIITHGHLDEFLATETEYFVQLLIFHIFHNVGHYKPCQTMIFHNLHHV